MPYDHVQNRPVTVALVQMSCTEAKQPNVEKAIGQIEEAAKRGANVVCLQELFTGPYFCQTEDHRWFAEAEPIFRRAWQLGGDLLLERLSENETLSPWGLTGLQPLGRVLAEQKRPQEALQLYRQAADCPPPSPAYRGIALLSLADLLTELGREDEAIPLYQQVHADDPSSAWAAKLVICPPQ